jgi:ferredoxin-NADP reductase
MARTAIRGRLTWEVASVIALADETPRVRSLVLDVPGWPGHLPGQHVDVRLTAEDGYQTERSYSIATPADGTRVTISVERIDDGEVSPYLDGELRVGDQLELRGPIGGYFVWTPGDGRPLLLAGGGSGIVPLMAMLRARITAGTDVPVRLLVSARSIDEIIYRAELESIASANSGVEIRWTLTRTQPSGWTGYGRRVDRAMLAEIAWPVDAQPRSFACGPTGFVETVASGLVELGHEPGNIRTERFGPTGG